MLIYRFDGTLAGLLTACGEALRRKDDPAAFVAGEAAAGFFDEVVDIPADDVAARETAETIRERISPLFLRNFCDAFRSESDGIATLLWRYLKLGLREGRRTDSLLAHDDVLPVHRLARSVRMEAHRMKGFVRFREVGCELYYAGIEPRYAILPLLGAHFRERFADRCWIIHDLRRGRGLLYDCARRECVETELELTAEPVDTEREERLAGLWRAFFATVAVEERENRRLQRQKVGGRYRRHLTEFR